METLLYVLSALLALSGLALVWLGWDSVKQARRSAALEAKVTALESRADRLQDLLEGKKRGWGDSLDLTRFNWERPGPF